MSDHWLYCEDLPAECGHWTLRGPEAQHARVKRLEESEAVHLFDGRGRVAGAEVVDAGKQALIVRIVSLETVRPVLPRLTMAVSQPKGDRLDWMLEKLTELAVARIIPIQCERSVAHARHDRTDRWERRLIEAAKQAHVAWLPTIGEPCKLADLIADRAQFTHMLVADTDTGTVPILSAARSLDVEARPAAIVGPEGGFSDTEREMMRQAGVRAIGLGSTVLRTETAAIVSAACLLNAANAAGDKG